tara:strand:- start:236 stop:493 length:258 start_codon:yes stop_codon:yes gene_type:complete
MFFFSFGALLSRPAFWRFFFSVLLYYFFNSLSVNFFASSCYFFCSSVCFSLLSFELEEESPVPRPFLSGLIDFNDPLISKFPVIG